MESAGAAINSCKSSKTKMKDQTKSSSYHLIEKRKTKKKWIKKSSSLEFDLIKNQNIENTNFYDVRCTYT